MGKTKNDNIAKVLRAIQNVMTADSAHPLREYSLSSPADDDDLSLGYFNPRTDQLKKFSRKVIFESAEAAPGPNLLDVLIFTASVCLWITSGILGGSHVVGAIYFFDSYRQIFYKTITIVLVGVHIIFTVVEILTAICASICVNYETEYHDVIRVAKMTIGLLSANFTASLAMVVLNIVAHSQSTSKHRFNSDHCKDECGREIDIIIHLFIGCTYEATAINICCLPVIVLVLKKAVLFVKSDDEERKRKIKAASREDSKKSRQRKSFHRHSVTSLIETSIPENKSFEKWPSPSKINDPPVRNDMDAYDSVIKMLTEPQVHPWNRISETSPRESVTSGESRSANSPSPLEERQRSPSDSKSASPLPNLAQEKSPSPSKSSTRPGSSETSSN